LKGFNFFQEIEKYFVQKICQNREAKKKHWPVALCFSLPDLLKPKTFSHSVLCYYFFALAIIL